MTAGETHWEANKEDGGAMTETIPPLTLFHFAIPFLLPHFCFPFFLIKFFLEFNFFGDSSFIFLFQNNSPVLKNLSKQCFPSP